MAGQRKTLLETVKANPVISGLAAIALIATTVTGAIAGLGQLDALVMTHAEHDADLIEHGSQLHAGATEAIEDLKAWNRCDRLERKLASLEDRLWRAEQAEGTDPQIIRDIRQDISNTQQQFDALNCAEVLTG